MMKINSIKKGFGSYSQLLNKRQYNNANGIKHNTWRFKLRGSDINCTKGYWDMGGGEYDGPPVYIVNKKHLYFVDVRFTKI